MLLFKNIYIVVHNYISPLCSTRKWLSHAKSLCSPKDIKKFGLDHLDAEINMLVELLSQGYQEIGFCHNDLQYGNIMMDEDTRTITLIVSYILLYFSYLFYFIGFVDVLFKTLIAMQDMSYFLSILS